MKPIAAARVKTDARDYDQAGAPARGQCGAGCLGAAAARARTARVGEPEPPARESANAGPQSPACRLAPSQPHVAARQAFCGSQARRGGLPWTSRTREQLRVQQDLSLLRSPFLECFPP